MKSLGCSICSYVFMSAVACANDFYSFGVPNCGYGRYTTENGCVEYGTLDAGGMCNGSLITGGACLNAFLDSSAEIVGLYPFNSGYGDFGISFVTTSTTDSVCGDSDTITGGACLNAFINSAAEIDGLNPFSGGYGDFGVASDIFETRWENGCMDGYYVTNAADDMFVPLQNGECATGRTSFIVANDCQYINTTDADSNNILSAEYSDNWMCGKLCDTGKIYTGTGACSTFCTTDGQARRLHIKNDEYDFSVPLYTDKLTFPAMNFSIYDNATGTAQMCYMNLLPRKDKNQVVVEYQGKRLYSSK